jgi:ABC-type multidrug transport system ATPase subunit
LIILIDEPEIHLHPELQKEVVKKLLEISKFAQVFITSHSPLLVHHLSESGNECYNEILLEENESGQIYQKKIDSRVLPNSTPAETNYLVFDRSSFEYHNELYGHLMYLSDKNSVSGLDNSFDINDNEKYNWEREDVNDSQRLSVHSVLRNSFHHKENSLNEYVDSGFINDNLRDSIEFLREEISSHEN